MNRMHFQHYFLMSLLCSGIGFFTFNASQLHAFEKKYSNVLSSRALHSVPNEILIKFRSRDLNSRTKPVLYKANIKKRFRNLNIEHWKLTQAQDLDETLKKLRNDPSVQYAEPNIRRFPKSSRMNQRIRAKNVNSQARLAQVNLPELWNIAVDAARLDNKVRVAVLDDAFDIEHPEFAGNIIFPFDALDNDDDPSPEFCDDEFSEDLDTHGTQVLGVLAANRIELENRIELNGAADHAEFIPIRMGCEYLLSAELAAYEHVISNNVDIVSLSWGGPLYSELERDAIYQLAQKNILVVVAAGNWEVDNDRIPDYPSSIDLPNILSVAATNENDILTDWTQYGSTSVDIAAPGEGFYTTDLSADGYTSENFLLDGTSFSAPLVAGVAASLMARDASASVYDIKAALMATAEPFADDLKARLVTDGYINAIAAYDFLQNNRTTPVIIISGVNIDDAIGNRNGEVDENEEISLKITLENINAAASNLSMRLVSTDLDFISQQQLVTNFDEFDSATFQASRIEKQFDVDFGSQLLQQDMVFTLEGEGFDQIEGRSFTFSRAFTLDTGSLRNKEPVSAVIRRSTKGQDDFHYYHIDVVKPVEKLEIILDAGFSDLDMIVKKDNPPSFIHTEYADDEPVLNENVEEGAIVAAETAFGKERIVFMDVLPGTYHIVVVTPEKTSLTNIEYTLEARVISRKSDSDRGIFGLFLYSQHIIAILILIISFRVREFTLWHSKNHKY